MASMEPVSREPASRGQRGKQRRDPRGVTSEDLGQDSAVTAVTQERPVIAVANRLPVQHGENGWELSPGGLVTALRPVMAAHPGAWVGWDGGSKGMPARLP